MTAIWCQTEELLAAIPEVATGRWQVCSAGIVGVLHHRRKWFVFIRVGYRAKGEGKTRTAQVVAKVDPDGRGLAELEALRHLWVAGLRPPGRYQVPRPYGYAPGPKALLEGAAPGTLWVEYLQGRPGQLAAASRRAAGWLRRFQSLAVEADLIRPDPDATCAQAAELAKMYPEVTASLKSVADRLADLLTAYRGSPVPAHGDYHPKQVFLSPGLTTVVDFEAFGLREPAFDVGHAVGQLLSMSYFRTGSFAAGAVGAAAFWQAYRQGGLAEWSRVRVHVGRTLIQVLHYALVRLGSGRPEMVADWVRLIRAFLDSGPEVLAELGTPTGR